MSMKQIFQEIIEEGIASLQSGVVIGEVLLMVENNKELDLNHKHAIKSTLHSVLYLIDSYPFQNIDN
ncbi:hypothetical protein C3744_29075 [Priestia megaterium]|uniref:Uncharacterized protein n=1 Tax=Priestia megaterium TaxID=1404 RepID=A0A3D8WTH0_PRIMG|nr:hypothetical protein [Priestia megaterium]MDH3168910.1 hypothetical protein [Priestia megaterium]RDZ05859.1 hypothetical protein C3744_29075 [Priestia megaterium]